MPRNNDQDDTGDPQVCWIGYRAVYSRNPQRAWPLESQKRISIGCLSEVDSTLYSRAQLTEYTSSQHLLQRGAPLLHVKISDSSGSCVYSAWNLLAEGHIATISTLWYITVGLVSISTRNRIGFLLVVTSIYVLPRG